MRRSIVMLCAAAAMAMSVAAHAADAEAGKAKAEKCSECHTPADFKGTSEADLATMIKGVASGSKKHPKKLTLTDADMANIAAYWVSAAK